MSASANVWGQHVDSEKGSSLGENPSRRQVADLPIVRHFCSPAQQNAGTAVPRYPLFTSTFDVRGNFGLHTIPARVY